MDRKKEGKYFRYTYTLEEEDRLKRTDDSQVLNVLASTKNEVKFLVIPTGNRTVLVHQNEAPNFNNHARSKNIDIVNKDKQKTSKSRLVTLFQRF